MWGAEQNGTVRSGAVAIPGASVTATQGEKKLVTTTDEAGRYAFSNLDAGAWTLQVEMFGFSATKREITVEDKASTIEWKLELKPRGEPAPASAPISAVRPPQPQRGRPGGPAGGPGPNGRAFQNLNLNETPEGDALEAAVRAPEAVSPEGAANANEAFLVNGSLSAGLNTPGQQGPFFPREGEGFAFQRDGFPGDPNNPGGPGFGPGGEGPGGPGGMAPGRGGPGGGPGGGGPGFGGPGGGGGGFGGGGGRGGGFGGGPGPFGGRGPDGRRGGPGARQRPGEASFGNRRANARANGIRGGLNLQLSNSAFDARPYSLTGQTVPKSSYGSGNFGFMLGGPLHIPKLLNSDKTFFMLNYRGTRSRTSFNAVSTVPTLLERSGDFSQSFVRGPVTIFDPTTHAPFPGNQIPRSQLNSAALGLLPFIPLPNQPGSIQNYQIVTSIPVNSDNFGLMLNRTLTTKDRLNGNFNWQRGDRVAEQVFGYRDSSTNGGMSLALGWSHTLGRRAANNLRWNFSRSRGETVPFFAYGDDVAARLGIRGTSSNPINYGPPNLSFTNFGALTDASPSLTRNQTSAVSEGLQFTKKSHNLSMGGEFRRLQFNSLTDSNARGTFLFSGLATSALDPAGQPLAATGYDLADFLLGFPQQSSVRFGSSDTYFRGSVYNAYALDDWRLRNNLTVNIGLRYEYFAPLTEKYNRLANLDIAPGFTGVAVVTPGKPGPYTGDFPNGLVNPDKNNISPRIGIAWRPTRKGRLMIRAGYGMFYNGSIYSNFTRQLGSQPPFAASSGTLTTSLAQPLTLQNGFPTAASSIITNTYAIDRYYALGYAQTWNLSVQREFPHSIVVELGYQGTKGTKLDIQRLPNRAAPGSPLTAEQRRQIGNAQGFTFESSEGNSIYHALQTRVTRRMQRGIAVNAIYTFGKSIDNASTFGGGGATVAQNDKDLSAERGLSSFDRRHSLQLNALFSSPAGKGSFLPDTGLGGRLLKDWTLNGSVTAQSGSPFTARVLGNQSNSGGTGSVGSGRADSTGLPVDAVLPGQYFNLAAFAIPQAGTFGNAARNTIQGPGTIVANLSLMRSFQLGDSRRRINFSVNSLNFLNHAGIVGIGTVVNSSTYGLATSAQRMRTLSLGLRLNF
jgi:hypothetical protein